ncbi:HEPN domain-containing protein [Aeromonas hydrophila]|uniref:HEPN domain-containing protein n=1 Tax=Aeromonas hydrophila TaxID=644 RepID=UPI001FC8B840|nr:HEPN domain-containing protein [Aeromonas hydrophila]GKQ99905.1 hypothetical protein KAM461_41550 [Aeromonas hydrophila]
MAINLHDGCKQRLKSQLSIVLADVRLRNLSFVERSSLYRVFDLESILPNTGNIKSELESYVSESPLFDFVYGELSKIANDIVEYDSTHPDEPLSILEGFNDLSLVASNLVDKFDSLPWKYAFTFNLGTSITDFFTEDVIEIAPDIKLLKAHGELADKFPLNSGIPNRDRFLHGGGLLGLAGHAEWKEKSLYVQITASGFVGKYVTTTPENRAVDTFKSFLGLMLAMRALKVSYSYSSSIINSRFYIHKETNIWTVEDSHELDRDVSKTISDLRLDDLDGSLDTDEKKNGFVLNRLRLISKALSREEAEKLRLAGKWLFDSYCGNNELLSFIQTTVSLEILLGDKSVSDLMGLGELLRNRCAYLIGNTHSQREEILDDFKKIYDIRSKIVHRGKSQLSRYERRLFHKLQWMTNRVIQEEIELIGKNA